MKISHKKVFQFLFYVIPAMLAIIFFILFMNKNNELHKTENGFKDKVEKYSRMRKELIADYKEKEKLFGISKNFKMNNIALFDHYINEMKKKGLANPVDDIISDLQKHPELIPYNGTLGGTMGFYFKKEIWVLNSKWVFAYFEDGHTSGYLLLEYTVTDDGRINWKRIAAMMD